MPNVDSGDDWVPLSTAVARMGELGPIYRTHRSPARSHLENAIRANRIELRGHRVGARSGPPVAIGPVSFRHEVNLFHDTLSLRRPGPSGPELLFRDVELEWIGAARYLRAISDVGSHTDIVVAITPKNTSDVSRPPAAAKRAMARGPRPKVRERVEDLMRSELRARRLTKENLETMPQKEMQAKFEASRETCVKARRQILSEPEFVGDLNPDK